MQSKNTAGRAEFAAITFFALVLFLPFRTIQYDINGISEARAIEAGDVFHKNHMLYRPLGYLVHRAAKVAGTPEIRSPSFRY